MLTLPTTFKKDTVEKMRLVFMPYLYCFTGVLFFCILFHWIFVIELDCITTKDDRLFFLLPVVVAFAVVFLFLGKKFKVLKYKKENGSNVFYFIALFGIIIPTIIAQEYLETATGKLTVINTIDDIKRLPETKYYQLNDYFFHKNGVSISQKVHVTGKRNNRLNFNIYAITPVFKKEVDTLNNSTDFWLCHYYSTDISNKLSEAVKEQKFKEFHLETEQKFKDDSFEFKFLERLKYQHKVPYYKKALDFNSFNSSVGEDVFLKIHTEKFEERNGSTLRWFFITSLLGFLLFALALVLHKLKSAYEMQRDEKAAARRRAMRWSEKHLWLIPQKHFFITPILIYINVLIFIALVVAGAGFFSFDIQFLFDWGGVLRFSVQKGDVWRLVTAQFLHGNIVQLLSNMISLYFIGIFLEPLLGKTRYLLIYLLCGIVAFTASILWNNNILSVGATGAIFGLYGLTAFLVFSKVFNPIENKIILIFGGSFLVYNLIAGLSGHADNAANIGGLVTGLFIGAIGVPLIEEKKEKPGVRKNRE